MSSTGLYHIGEETVWLESFFQERVDSWVDSLDGRPARTKELVRHVVRRAHQFLEANRESTRWPLILLPGQGHPLRESASPAPIESCPRILCVAELQCNRSIHDSLSSTMLVAWFQDQLALPVDPKALALISSWNWDELAEPFDP